ncbi:MAG: hypothetical protein NTV32_02050 [Gammaproteobacteria bacterium]|jgi:hypothetical protein|nr:hypothetical protein [Gammaproteobacteria bacterium]
MSIHTEAKNQLSDKVERLKLYAQALKGKELKLQQKESELLEREIKLKLYRKNILVAIKEQLTEGNVTYDEQVKVLNKYKDILQDIAQDVQHDIDEIMG